MGVSGSGKTTVGKALASELKVPFYDADDFHPQSNIVKMKQGIPLDDLDRKSWLEILSKNLVQWEASTGAVLASESLFWSYGTADLAIMDNTYSYPGSNRIFDSLDIKYGNMIKELRRNQISV
jgi:uridine kinase